MKTRHKQIALFLAVLLFAVSQAGSLLAKEGAGPLILSELPAPHQPLHPLTEAEQDHQEALSYFMAAQMAQMKKDFAPALRFYQRTLLFNPESVESARMIVALTIELGREQETIRYALRLAELEEEPEADLLRHLGAVLVQQGEYLKAAELFERSAIKDTFPPKTPQEAKRCLDTGRLYHIADAHDKAAMWFERFLDYITTASEKGGEEKRKAREIAGDWQLTCRLCAESFLEAERFELTEKTFRLLNEDGKEENLLQYFLAKTAFRQGKAEQSLKMLTDVMQEDSLKGEGVEPYVFLGEVFESLDRKEEYLPAIRDLHKRHPSAAPIGYQLARLYREAEDWKQAEPLYQALTHTSPTLTGFDGLVKIYIETKQPEKLLDALGQVGELTQGFEAIDEMIELVVERQELAEKVNLIARKQVKTLGFGRALTAARIAAEMGLFVDADRFFYRAIETRRATIAADTEADPKLIGRLYFAWGLGMLIDEQSGRAEKAFRAGLRDKKLVALHPIYETYLAMALADQDKTQPALDAARRAVALDETSAAYHARVAWVLQRQERFDEAEQAYQDMILRFGDKYDSEETRGAVREAKTALAALYAHQDETERAEECLLQVLEEFPGDIGAMNDLGYLWTEHDQHLERAHRMVQVAVEDQPENAAYRDSLGWVYYKLGEYEEAAESLEKAVRLAEENNYSGAADAEILDHLGDVYLKLDRKDEAMRMWQQAVENYTENELEEEAAEVQKKIDQHKNSIN